MKTILKVAFIHELDIQAQYAIHALQQVNTAIKGPLEVASPPLMDFYRSEVFRNIHSFLTHTGNISKIFWPDKRTKAEQRGEMLRSEYKLASQSVLNKRSLRNDHEHYDDRLDTWGKEDRDGILPDLIMSSGSLRELELDNIEVMRRYDPQSSNFYFRGVEYDLKELLAAVHEIRTRSIALLEQEWRTEEGEMISTGF